jgi:hypothetical protein
MLHAADDGRQQFAESYLNTLKNGGFIKNATQEERDKKITQITDEQEI